MLHTFLRTPPIRFHQVSLYVPVVYLAIIASNSSGVFPVGSYSSLPEDISSMSFSNSAECRFMVTGDSDGARGSSSSYSSGESYTTSVPEDGVHRPTVSRHETGGMAGAISGSSPCRINHVACYHESITHIYTVRIKMHGS